MLDVCQQQLQQEPNQQLVTCRKHLQLGSAWPVAHPQAKECASVRDTDRLTFIFAAAELAGRSCCTSLTAAKVWISVSIVSYSAASLLAGSSKYCNTGGAEVASCPEVTSVKQGKLLKAAQVGSAWGLRVGMCRDIALPACCTQPVQDYNTDLLRMPHAKPNLRKLIIQHCICSSSANMSHALSETD